MRVYVMRSLASEDAIDMAIARNLDTVIRNVAVRVAQKVKRALGALWQEALVERAVHEPYREPKMPQIFGKLHWIIREVYIGAVEGNDATFSDHDRQVLE